jgi:hypothetical protein
MSQKCILNTAGASKGLNPKGIDDILQYRHCREADTIFVMPIAHCRSRHLGRAAALGQCGTRKSICHAHDQYKKTNGITTDDTKSCAKAILRASNQTSIAVQWNQFGPNGVESLLPHHEEVKIY